MFLYFFYLFNKIDTNNNNTHKFSTIISSIGSRTDLLCLFEVEGNGRGLRQITDQSFNEREK